MYTILSQATQPLGGGFSSWTAADWVLIIGAIGAFVATWRRAGDAKEKATEAKTTATVARTVAEQNTGRLDRQSVRMSDVEDKAATALLYTQPPATAAAPKPTQVQP